MHTCLINTLVIATIKHIKDTGKNTNNNDDNDDNSSGNDDSDDDDNIENDNKL